MIESVLKKTKKPIITPETKDNDFGKRVNRIFVILHLFVYVAVSGLLTLIWAFEGGLNFFWPVFAMLGWGIGIGIHLITYLIYYDIIPYFTKVKQQSKFAVFFIYHALVYTLVNLLILMADIITPGSIFFYWPLSMWGIIFGCHAAGFLMMMNYEAKKMKGKIPDFDEKKLQFSVKTKIVNFWVLIAHIAYFIVGTIMIYTMDITSSGNLTIIEATMMWATLLGVHAFGYYLYYYIDSIEGVMKGLIVHIAFYAATIGWLIYAYTQVQERIFYPLYPMILWGILIAFHVFISMKWDDILKGALATVERQFEDLEKYDLRAKAKRLFFWQWSLIAHIAIYAVGLVLIGLTMAIESVDIGLLIHPAMGWAIAIVIHSSFYIINLKNIQGFLKGTFAIHLATYISVGIYLIILNAMIGGYPFSAIALVGWGIGLGIHYIIAYVR